MGEPLRAWRARMRRELPLPEAELLAGAGHQAEVWHPGILAKFVWADELARREAARGHAVGVVHLLVDTDLRDPLAMRAPVRAGGTLGAARHSFGGDARAAGLAPEPVALARPAGPPRPFAPPPDGFALDSVAAGVAALESALARHAGAANAALQAWRALAECLGGTPGLAEAGDWRMAEPVRTGALLRTTLGEALLDRAARDADACAGAFNRAVAHEPRAARPLAALGDAGVEVPFWRIAQDGARHRVGARELAALRSAGALLVPRAFLTSAIARAALCDRFVHGTGGERYERATDLFIEAWLGAPLPRFDAATATVLLPLPDAAAAPGGTRVERRRAWFDPEAEGEPMSAAKREHLAAIAAAPRRSAARRAAWRALHAWLARARAARGAALAPPAAGDPADRAAAAAAEVRAERGWPVPLHAPVTLARMAERLRARP
jgi:hypothetical protein